MVLGLAVCQSIIAAHGGGLIDECELKPLIDTETLHEDVIPSFQGAEYHQSSEFDRAMTDMSISDRKASISASKLGWTSCSRSKKPVVLLRLAGISGHSAKTGNPY